MTLLTASYGAYEHHPPLGLKIISHCPKVDYNTYNGNPITGELLVFHDYRFVNFYNVTENSKIIFGKHTAGQNWAKEKQQTDAL